MVVGPLGVINTSASFLIVSLQNNDPYVLNGVSPSSGSILYYWEKNLTSALNGSFLPIFMSSSSGSPVIQDTTNGGGIGFRSDGITIGNALNPPSIKITQTQYTPPNPPGLFLSNVIYTIYNNIGDIATVLTSPSTSSSTILANNIIILPVLWYFDCTTNGNYYTINTPENSLINWFCLNSDNSPTECQNMSLAPDLTWTNIPECIQNVNYQYCTYDNLCGEQNNCNGPCSNTNDICEIQSPSNVFGCTSGSSVINWTPIFIGILIFLAITIVIFVVLGIFFLHRKK